MTKIARFAFTAAMLVPAGLWAHHGYADYDREATVEVTGTVVETLWANPHVVITIDAQGAYKGQYRVEWWDMLRLERGGLAGPIFKQGDRVVITAAINRNPERKILTLVREIHRPADGWQWTDPRQPAAAK